jgi:methylenetetrahydrofolate dehydrogenase (NADP+)/methenyltetrahydrofolate cyclohydrolase
MEGKPLAAAILADTAGRVARLQAQGTDPTLALVRVGDDPASKVYLKRKGEACHTAGIRSEDHVFPPDLPRGDLLEFIREQNRNPRVHGILVQFPLPRQHDPMEVSETIDPDKDVDGFHPLNAGRLVSGLPGLIPCTPLGVLLLLKHHGVDMEGKAAVVLGRSLIVGRPLANLLSRKSPGLNATVTMVHSQSGDVARFTRQADVLIAAMGRPRSVTGDMIKPGAVVVDVGINRIDDPASPGGRRLVGDVDFESARPVASRITPVPGGVGPLTVACLCRNTWAAAARDFSDPLA